MKNLFRLILLSILLSPVIAGAQTSAELTNILAGSQASLNVVGQSGQSASGNNILLATAGSGSTDVTTLGTITYRSFSVQVIGSAGISAGQIIFESSNDNTTWDPLTVNDDAVIEGSGAPVSGAITIAASTNRFFSGVIKARYIRLRISTGFTGGTVQAISTFSPSDIPAPTGDFYVAGASAQTATVNNILTPTSGTAPTDALTFRSFAVQIVSTATGGTFIFEGSNDNTNFQPVTVYNQALTNPTPIVAAITPTASQITYVGSIAMRYFRVRIATTITGGSIQAFTVLRQTPFTSGTTLVAQASAGNLQTTATIASGTVTTVSTVTTVTTLSQFAASAAAADATTNPTTTIVRAVDHLFNGTTWDRYYSNWNTTTGDAGAKTTTFNGATQTNFNARGAIITCNVTAVSGTSPTMIMQLQWSPDGGTTWLAWGNATITRTATGTSAIVIYPTNLSTSGATPSAFTVGSSDGLSLNGFLPRTWRINYTIGGTTPSFTIGAVWVNYIL